MNVDQLIRLLSTYDPDALVLLKCDAGQPYAVAMPFQFAQKLFWAQADFGHGRRHFISASPDEVFETVKAVLLNGTPVL